MRPQKFSFLSSVREGSHVWTGCSSFSDKVNRGMEDLAVLEKQSLVPALGSSSVETGCRDWRMPDLSEMGSACVSSPSIGKQLKGCSMFVTRVACGAQVTGGRRAEGRPA